MTSLIKKYKIFPMCVLIVWIAFPQLVQAKMEPKWEFGGIFAHIRTPHYSGSNEFYARYIALPFGIYRGKSSEANRGLKIFENFYGLNLSLTLGLKLPVTTNDIGDATPDNIDQVGTQIVRDNNFRRRGMDPIPLLVGLGLNVGHNFTQYLSLRMRFLNYVTAGGGFHGKGYTLTPLIRINFLEFENDFIFSVIHGYEYGNAELNNLYYGVDDKEVLDERPGYRAGAGLIQQTTTLVTGVEKWRVRFILFLSYSNMNDSVVKNSPLVINKTNTRLGVGFSYAFYRSDETVFRGIQHTN